MQPCRQRRIAKATREPAYCGRTVQPSVFRMSCACGAQADKPVHDDGRDAHAHTARANARLASSASRFSRTRQTLIENEAKRRRQFTQSREFFALVVYAQSAIKLLPSASAGSLCSCAWVAMGDGFGPSVRSPSYASEVRKPAKNCGYSAAVLCWSFGMMYSLDAYVMSRPNSTHELSSSASAVEARSALSSTGLPSKMELLPPA